MNETIHIIHPSTLTPHPENVKIYGHHDADSIQDILHLLTDPTNLEPVIVSERTNHIISGHRRVRSVLSLGLPTVPVIYRWYDTDEAEIEALLSANVQRDKSIEARVREALRWEEIEARKARERQVAAAHQTNAKRNGTLGVDSTPSVVTNGKSRDPRVRDIIAERCKFSSGSTYDNARRVVTVADTLAAEGRTDEAYGLLYVLNQQSIDAAIKCIREANEEVRNRALRSIAQHGQSLEQAEQEVLAAIREEQEQAREAAEEHRRAAEAAQRAKEAEERAAREAEEREQRAREAEERARTDEQARKEAARLAKEAREAGERADQEREAWEQAQRVAAQKAEEEAAARKRAAARAKKSPAKKDRKCDVKREITAARQAMLEEQQPPTMPEITDRYRLIHSPIETLALDTPVDVIMTDPPYPKEYLPVYEHLARGASQWLRSGGSCFVMVGQSYLPEVMQAMTRHLEYHWTLAYLTPGGQASQIWKRNVNTFWKPVLWFVNGTYDGPWIGDVTKSSANDNDKRFHAWGQSESGMAELVKRCSQPGQTILDPFCGGGTTGVVAITLGRHFIGADKDSSAIDKTRKRLCICQ